MTKNSSKPIICILNGPPGSGKTSLSLQLAQANRIKSRVVSADQIRDQMHNSKIFDTKEAQAILKNSTLLSAQRVLKYAHSKNKYQIIFLDDCIVERRRMTLYKSHFVSFKTISILLWPSAKIQKVRDISRGQHKMGSYATKLRAKMTKSKPHTWHDIVIDNSLQSPQQSANQINKILTRLQ